MKRVLSYSFSIALGISACTGFTKIGDGSTDGGAGAGGGTSLGCEKKPCGALCSSCDLTESNCLAMYCDGNGQCGDVYPTCSGGQCQTNADCPQLGAPCELCPDGSSACPTVECVNGECLGSFPTCDGTTCATDTDCPKSLAPCQLCADGTAACPWAHCVNGLCTSGIDSCPGTTDPCSGKSCGDYCSTCPPDASCPAVAMYCDPDAKCQYDIPQCPAPDCFADADCASFSRCTTCTDGSCAVVGCVAGACRYSCDGNVCAARDASCANGETCCGEMQCCNGSPIPIGSEYCSDSCPISDRNLKHDFASVNQEDVLDKLASMPISTWVYKTESVSERHIGPMAQDFMSTFHLGSDDRTILQVDGDGVSFAAIQALYARLQKLEQKNAALEEEVKHLRAHR